MKKHLPAILSLVVLAGILAFTTFNFQNRQEKAEIKLAEDVFFQGCAQGNNDLEFRRSCGKAAHAYANGKIDYEAYGKTITWDKEARMYVVKGEKK